MVACLGVYYQILSECHAQRPFWGDAPLARYQEIHLYILGQFLGGFDDIRTELPIISIVPCPRQIQNPF